MDQQKQDKLSLSVFYFLISFDVFFCAGDLFGQLMRQDPSTIKGAETLMLGEMLTLPQNFG